MAHRFTAVWVNHETRMPVHCAANVILGGIFYTYTWSDITSSKDNRGKGVKT